MIDLLYKDFVLLEKRFHDTQNYFQLFRYYLKFC